MQPHRPLGLTASRASSSGTGKRSRWHRGQGQAQRPTAQWSTRWPRLERKLEERSVEEPASERPAVDRPMS